MIVSQLQGVDVLSKRDAEMLEGVIRQALGNPNATLASLGVSRFQAERWVEAGVVQLTGEVLFVTSLGYRFVDAARLTGSPPWDV